MKNPDTPVNNVNTKHERSEFEESHRQLAKNHDTPVTNVNTNHSHSESEESCRDNWHP